MSAIKSRIPLLILLAGAVIRTATLGSAALWYDESVSLWRTGLPFMQIYTNGTDQSGSLLLDLLLRPLMAISHSLWLLRLPSLLASLVALYLVWRITQVLQFTYRQQLFACILAAFLPGLLWLAQDARSYSLLSVFFMAALYFAIESKFLGMAACLGLTIYCHNTGPVFAVAVVGIALYLYPWKARRILFTAGAACLAWIPAALHILFNSIGTTGPLQPWQATITLRWLVKSATTALWVNRVPWFQLAGAAVLLASLALLVNRSWKNRQRNTLLLTVFGPLAIMLVISLWNNVVLYRTLMPLLYVLALWLGYELGMRSANAYRLTLAGVWMALLATGLIMWRPQERGGGLDLAAAGIRAQWQAGDVLVYATRTVQLPFNYYLSDLPFHQWQGIQAPLLMEPGIQIADTGDLAHAKRIWLVKPEDGLITDAETQDLPILPYDKPIATVKYLQAATIKVFLIENMLETMK
jgi:hypothetical protein